MDDNPLIYYILEKKDITVSLFFSLNKNKCAGKV